mmetsp:Transcript_61426/g.187602  ORF Transcript_61426/g.187602 Transcript_61426/m.187602 type:complete len:252 (+) Transcript_61426:901-1656(+)
MPCSATSCAPCTATASDVPPAVAIVVASPGSSACATAWPTRAMVSRTWVSIASCCAANRSIVAFCSSAVIVEASAVAVSVIKSVAAAAVLPMTSKLSSNMEAVLSSRPSSMAAEAAAISCMNSTAWVATSMSKTTGCGSSAATVPLVVSVAGAVTDAAEALTIASRVAADDVTASVVSSSSAELSDTMSNSRVVNSLEAPVSASADAMATSLAALMTASELPAAAIVSKAAVICVSLTATTASSTVNSVVA